MKSAGTPFCGWPARGGRRLGRWGARHKSRLLSRAIIPEAVE
jgi:hypothetical protein